LLVGWREIGAYFRSSAKAMQSRYGKDLLDGGFAFRMRRGVPPRVYVCTWPSMLQIWAAALQEEYGGLDGDT
jgi:hypothetical protein